MERRDNNFHRNRMDSRSEYRGDHRNRPGGDRRDKRLHGPRPDRLLPKGTVVYILDVLQHGRVDRSDKPHHSWTPICQIIEIPNFQLFEIEMNKGSMVSIQDKVIISGPEGSLGKIQRKIKYEDLTPTSHDMLQETLYHFIQENESKYIEWFNKAGPITIKRHSLEVLPGIGKKIMWDIVNERNKKLFESFADMALRVPGLKPIELIAKRIVEELASDEEKHYLFVRRQKHQSEESSQHERPPRPMN